MLSLSKHDKELLSFYRDFFWGGKNGEPETIRTSDPQLRRLLLYPTELRALKK